MRSRNYDGTKTMTEKPVDYLPVGTRLRMLGDRILVRPLDIHWSDHIIAVRHGRPVRGEVVAVGPGCYPKKFAGDRKSYKLSRHFQPTQLKPGDIVELGGLNVFDGQGYAFPEIVIGTQSFVMCQEADVCGVVDAEAA